MTNNITHVAATHRGAALLGACPAWAGLAAGGFGPAAAALWPVPAQPMMLALAPSTGEALSNAALPAVNRTRKQSNAHQTRIDAGAYGAMGPHPEREPA